jgi:uncharacterized protein (DUF111 family)
VHELTQEQNVIRQYIMEFQQLFNLVSARMETSIDTNRQDIIELVCHSLLLSGFVAVVRIPPFMFSEGSGIARPCTNSVNATLVLHWKRV